MEKQKLEKINRKEELEKLPLVLEILPGQAREGLLVLFEPSQWQGKDLTTLVKEALNKDYSKEEEEILTKIKQQLDGGKLLYQGREIDKDDPLIYAIKETTEAGEEYLYINLHAIKPQEGGIKYFN